jgi:HK97 family phage major capsid protein
MPIYDSAISRSEAQALMPEDIQRAIWKNVPQQSAALSLFSSRRLSRGQQRVPVLSLLPLAYFVNGDTGLKQTTEVAWANKFLDVEELAVIVPIPDSVLADAEYGLWDEIQPLIEEAIGRTLDAAVFFGTDKPASWPTAIVPAAVAAGNVSVEGTSTTAQGGIAGDFSDLFGKVEGDGYDVNGVIAHRIMRAKLRNNRDTQGRKLDEAQARMGVGMDTIYGVDVKYPMRGQWPTTASSALAVAGDFSRGIIGIRQDITMTKTNVGVIQDNTGAIIHNLFQQDMTALRVVFRVAFQVANPINYDQPTEAQRYPFGVLNRPA